MANIDFAISSCYTITFEFQTWGISGLPKHIVFVKWEKMELDGYYNVTISNRSNVIRGDIPTRGPATEQTSWQLCKVLTLQGVQI